MSILHIDIETFSEEDLSSAGVYRYAEHPSTEVMCVGYAIDDGSVHLWIPYDDVPQAIVDAVQARHPTAVIKVGTKIPSTFLTFYECVDDGKPFEKRAHNAQFERVVLNGVAGRKLQIAKTDIKEWTCTAVKVAAMGLPRSLDDASKALGTHGKSEGGRIEMLQLSKPRKPTKADPSTRWTMQNAPDKWIAMLCYNIDDVLAERDLDNAVPDLEPREQELYWLDQKINEKGWAVDLEAVRNILFVVEQYKERLAAEFEELTRDWLTGVGLKPTQREKISDWVRAQGVSLPDMQAETIKCLLSKATRERVPSTVARVLKIYSTYNAKSVSKLQAMLDAVCADGRLRGMFLFYGAATGRWSSLMVQLQNIMRPVIKDPNTAIEAFASRDLDLIRLLWPDVDPMKVAGSCVRGCLISAPGSDLVFPDYSGIEDRVNLWFFDEEQMLEVYRQYDRIVPGKFDKHGKLLREGRHPYSITTCKLLGIPLETFSDEDPRRQIGKVVRLAMGYEGGVSAFVTMAETYSLDLQLMADCVLPVLSEEALDHAEWMHKNHPNNHVNGDIETACNGVKYLYRNESPGIKQGWKNLKEAAEKAVEFEGETFWLPNRKIAFRVETYRGRKWLAMRLPSGRKIRYFDPKWTPPRESERWINNELVPYTIPGFMDYMGVDTYTRQWMRLQTYGGKLDENADQGFSRDLLCNAMLSLDAAGYAIVGSEHDKAILEIPERPRRNEGCPNNGQVCAPGAYDSSEHCLACDDNRGGYSNPNGGVDFKLLSIKHHMVKQPAYADGLPLATDGKRCKRYGK